MYREELRTLVPAGVVDLIAVPGGVLPPRHHALTGSTAMNSIWIVHAETMTPAGRAGEEACRGCLVHLEVGGDEFLIDMLS